MKINIVFLIIVSIGFPACSLPRTTTRRRLSTSALARQGKQHKLPVSVRRSGVYIVDKKTRRRPNPIFELPNMNVGPKKNLTYNPTWGYEPYWEWGQWVFDPIEPDDNDMCGSRCLEIYDDYGQICGRNKHYIHKTFESYCEMRNYDCTGKDAWMIAYRGACTTIRTYPTHEVQIATRADLWLAQYSERIYS